MPSKYIIEMCLIKYIYLNVLFQYIQMKLLHVFFNLCFRRKNARCLTLVLKMWGKWADKLH